MGPTTVQAPPELTQPPVKSTRTRSAATTRDPKRECNENKQSPPTSGIYVTLGAYAPDTRQTLRRNLRDAAVPELTTLTDWWPKL